MCDANLVDNVEIKYELCDGCREGLEPKKGEKCKLCGKPLISEKDNCLSCRNNTDHSYERLWVLFPYSGKYRDLLTAYKFKKRKELAEFFAEQVKAVINENPELLETCLIPVPPRPGKIKEQGWDQVETLVKRTAAVTLLTVNRCIKRRKSQVQKELNRADRLENLKGRIYMIGAAPKTALIIDDVITTGATIEACAAILKEAGVEKVYGLCLFYD